MADEARARDAQAHATHIDYSLKELRRKVGEHEAELKKLRSSPGFVPQSAAGQADLIRTALEEVNNSEPFLPFSGSILPALLALRKTRKTIEESKAFLANHRAEIEKAERQLEADQASLRDQNQFTQVLKARVKELKDELKGTADMSPNDAAGKQLATVATKQTFYAQEISKMLNAINYFVDKRLAPMLAAEQLGGPVVGDAMDIDFSTLAAGFNAQGKVQKRKADVSEDKRQRRIDEIWGKIDSEAAGRGEREGGEIGAAATHMRQLTEELLNRLIEAGGDGSASYVELSQESAAARFLVRSKVAQFHPRDATRIRLIDFGRELDA